VPEAMGLDTGSDDEVTGMGLYDVLGEINGIFDRNNRVVNVYSSIQQHITHRITFYLRCVQSFRIPAN
jgi:hypothetical protein